MGNRNATASWSGYSHQGYVGILVALRDMRKLILAGKRNEFNIHYLEYENNEDVAISKQIAGATKELISVHQVKAYYSQGHLLSTYKSVFTGVPIYELDASGKILKDANGKKIETGTYEPGQWCDSDNFLHTVENIGNWPTDNDFSSVGGNPKSIKRYEYNHNIFFCGADQISNLIIAELVSDDFLAGNNGSANMSLKRLTFELDLKIRTEHATKDSKNEYEIQFSFKDIFDIINDSKDISQNESYICRNMFYELYYEALKKSSLSDDEISDIDLLIDQIYHSFSDTDFLLFIRRLSLNRNPKNQHITHSTYNEDGLKQVFFKLLLGIPNIYPDLVKEDFTVLYSSVRYILSTIIDEKEEAKDVVKNILTNLDSHKLLWEKTSIINKEINGTFYELNPDFFDIRKKEDKEKDFTAFMQYNGSTALVCRETAKTNLTNEDTN